MLIKKEFNASVLNTLKELKENMNKNKRVQENDTSTKKNINRETEIVKWNQKEILELKNTIMELKILLEGFNN